MIQFIGGNQITLLKSGNEYFPALLAAIENAHAEIYIQSYIYEMDSIGIRLGTALKDCLLYTSPSPRDRTRSRKPSSA